MAIARGRSVMALFSSPTSIHSHRVRFVLAEKGIKVEIVDVDAGNPPEDLIDLNPYQSVPTLVDRELVLYDAGVIVSYIDERYPHPPLMPVDPVSRARLRLSEYRIMRDLYDLLPDLEGTGKKSADAARKQISEGLAAADELFSVGKFFLHDELTLVDAAVAPLLWRLESYDIKLPKSATHIARYQDMIFHLPSFQDSLTEAERELRG